MSQKTEIRAHLLAGGKLSQLAALRDFGCMRLADVVFKLRRDGIPVETGTRTQKGKTFAVYTIPNQWLEEYRNGMRSKVPPYGLRDRTVDAA